ncbi:hypothetical protein D1872_51000 [compost metagenome]
MSNPIQEAFKSMQKRVEVLLSDAGVPENKLQSTASLIMTTVMLEVMTSAMLSKSMKNGQGEKNDQG